MDPLTIGLGLGGMAMGFLGGKNKRQRMSLDPETQNYLRWLRQLTQGDQMTLALRALGGDADAMTRMSGGSREFMRPIFERQRNQSAMRANEMATGAGGYGGSRSAVYNAILDRDINEQEQGMEYQAGQDSLARALQLLQIGQGYAGIAATPLWQDQPGQERNPWLGALGGALSGMGAAQQFGGGPSPSIQAPNIDMTGFDPSQIPLPNVQYPSLTQSMDPRVRGDESWLYRNGYRGPRSPFDYYDQSNDGSQWQWGEGWN